MQDVSHAQILKTLDKHSQILSEHSRTLAQHSGEFVAMHNQFFKINQQLDELNERTKYLPKMYDVLDKLAQEVTESRQDRVVVSSKLNDHENRIMTVEDKLGIIAQ